MHQSIIIVLFFFLLQMSRNQGNDHIQRRFLVAKSIYRYFRNRTQAGEGRGEIRGNTYVWSETPGPPGRQNRDRIPLTEDEPLPNMLLIDDLLRFMLTSIVMKHRMLSGCWAIFEGFLSEISTQEESSSRTLVRCYMTVWCL